MSFKLLDSSLGVNILDVAILGGLVI